MARNLIARRKGRETGAHTHTHTPFQHRKNYANEITCKLLAQNVMATERKKGVETTRGDSLTVTRTQILAKVT